MYAIDYEDFGTPAPVNGAATVTVEVDGRPVTVPDGTSVMRAAALAGVKVPKLCATDTLKAFGSCRLCLVEIEGRKGYPASCTTTVAAGMKIRTQSDKLLQLRRGVIDLYVSDHPLECASCPAQGHCALDTTCAYCGVGCGFKAEVRGEGADVEVVRMTPDRAGKANHGHACIKGRFAWGYATHSDRVLKPMIRKTIRDEWREVSWEEAIGYAASEIRRVQAQYGRDSVGGITSSRCTNEETFLVQKLVRAAFGNNNVDTCARVCHSPTGYGLKNTLGESAGTQAFDSVMRADVVMIIGANPTDGHPVFASQLKRRLRQGAKLIIADPREIALVRTPHIEADEHLQLKPGTNVALLNALAHVVVTEGLTREAYVAERCEPDSYAKWKAFVAEPRNSPEESESITGVPAERVRRAARLYARAGNGAIYYGLGVTEHSQGTTAVMGIANLAMATGNLGREGVGVSPLRGQNNVQGSCDMGSFPHEFSAYRHVSDPAVR